MRPHHPTGSRLLSALLAIALAPGLLRAQAGQLVPTSTGEPDPSILSLRSMRVDASIARGYARIGIVQIFENHTGDVQEGTYRFRLPPSGAVGDFAVWDGLVRIPGVILEKQRARAIYRDLTTRNIDPGLLQQGEEEMGEEEEDESRGPSSGGLFSVTVAPIPAWGTKRIEIQIQQEVPVIGSRGELRLALAPPEGEAPVAGTLQVRVHLDGFTAVAARAAEADAEAGEAGAEAADGADVDDEGDEGEVGEAEDGTDEDWLAPELPLTIAGAELTFEGKEVTMDHDIVVHLAPATPAPLVLSAFRNPAGQLPDGLALAPWERPSEIPPEKDGFFLLEVTPGEPPAADGAGGAAAAPKSVPLRLVVLFDVSLSHRFAGLEDAYASLVKVLEKLKPSDAFAIVPYHSRPLLDGKGLREATKPARAEALAMLRGQALEPGNDLVAALASARELLARGGDGGGGGRILLLSDGQTWASSDQLKSAMGDAVLHASITGDAVEAAIKNAAATVLEPVGTGLERDLFFERLLDRRAPRQELAAGAEEGGEGDGDEEALPFVVRGGEPKLSRVYPVLLQPMEPGSLSGFVGRYGVPVPALTWELTAPGGVKLSLDQGLPESALEARDLPRRWARARVDDLLRRIEAEGEREDWIEEIIELSSRYKFVTPYTAFLAAPRALLRPRRIQPGDPVLRVTCDPSTVRAEALFDFGLRLPLSRRPGTDVWEGRFLVPVGIAEGRHPVRIALRDRQGRLTTETKHFVLDGKAPVVVAATPGPVSAGGEVTLSVRTDEDVVVLLAKLGDAAPVPLRWDPAVRRSTGRVPVPATMIGLQEIVVEAVDGANNRGFVRVPLHVLSGSLPAGGGR